MKLIGRKTGEKGIALTLAIMMMICTSILGGYALQAGWNQRKLSIQSGSKRDKIYWAAKAGVVDARWRIRNNYTGAPMTGGDFTDNNFDPPAYSINIDGVGANDVTINVGPVVGGIRSIDSQGLDF